MNTYDKIPITYCDYCVNWNNKTCSHCTGQRIDSKLQQFYNDIIFPETKIEFKYLWPDQLEVLKKSFGFKMYKLKSKFRK